MYALWLLLSIRSLFLVTFLTKVYLRGGPSHCAELIGHVLYALPLKARERLLMKLSACLRAWTDGCALSAASLPFLEQARLPSTDDSLYRKSHGL